MDIRLSSTQMALYPGECFLLIVCGLLDSYYLSVFFHQLIIQLSNFVCELRDGVTLSPYSLIKLVKDGFISCEMYKVTQVQARCLVLILEIFFQQL